MIPFDFVYYKPTTLNEAIECFRKLSAEKKTALYYGGGTEIISMARAESFDFDGVIDIKAIPECNILRLEKGRLSIGAGVTLSRIAESELFPLLGKTVSRIADHTIQGKITFGGNLCGTIIYKEAALPLMITDCTAKIMSEKGLRELPFSQVFDGKLRLEKGEFLVEISIPREDILLPYNHVKKTKIDKIDYPLISMAANKKNGEIRGAVSGAGRCPILLPVKILNNRDLPEEERIEEILGKIDDLLLEDIHASKEYRKFVLKNILSQMYENLNSK